LRFKLTSEAKKYIDSQDKTTVKRIYETLRAITKEPPEGDIKTLSGQNNVKRARVGEMRIIYEIKGDHAIIIKIAPRGQTYKQ